MTLLTDGGLRIILQTLGGLMTSPTKGNMMSPTKGNLMTNEDQSAPVGIARDPHAVRLPVDGRDYAEVREFTTPHGVRGEVRTHYAAGTKSAKRLKLKRLSET